MYKSIYSLKFHSDQRFAKSLKAKSCSHTTAALQSASTGMAVIQGGGGGIPDKREATQE